MTNFDDVTKKNKKHNRNWPPISDHPYITLIIGGSRYVKTIHYLI